MVPELGQTIVAQTDGKGPAFTVMEVDGARAACPVRIKLDTILSETDPIAAAGFNLGIVWSPRRTPQVRGI